LTPQDASPHVHARHTRYPQDQAVRPTPYRTARDSVRVLRWAFDTEGEALAMVKRLLAADAGGQWRKQSGDSQPPQQA